MLRGHARIRSSSSRSAATVSSPSLRRAPSPKAAATPWPTSSPTPSCFSAVTGIGTAGNAIETETSFIEAETNTGGINLSNYGPLQIGNISSTSRASTSFTSGNIIVTTTGFFLFNDTTGTEVVHGGDISGNVTLSAIGPDSDMFATVDLPVVSAAGGGITLNVGRDLYLGTAAANFNNDVLATGDINIHAGRDFVLDGTSNVQTSAFGGILGGDINITCGAQHRPHRYQRRAPDDRGLPRQRRR